MKDNVHLQKRIKLYSVKRILFFVALAVQLISLSTLSAAENNNSNDRDTLNAAGPTIAAGLYHSLYVKKDGTLWGMGYNKYGQLGDGTNTDRNKPVKIDNDVVQAAGKQRNRCKRCAA